MQNNLAYNAYSQNQVGIESPQNLLKCFMREFYVFVQELK